MKAIEKNNCTSCRKKDRVSKKSFGLLGSLLLALLPKCPFCIMAYSGTLMLCGKDTVSESHYTSTSTATIILTSFFCLLTLLSIYFNKRGSRTRYALLISTIGTCFVISSTLFYGGWGLYYTGVGIIFTGVWLNGSMLYFACKLKQFFDSGIYHKSEKPSLSPSRRK
jgi:hypothetical protein